MTFAYYGTELALLDHPYNSTALNERAVEVPVARSWLGSGDGHGLEVGNVLTHYGVTVPRTVVDLFEEGADVENVDIFDFQPQAGFDWIVSISTVEHVAWDPPQPRVNGRAAQAIEHLAGLLNPGGQMLVTVPLGYHAPLDDVLLAGGTSAHRACTLVRADGGWHQTDTPQARPYSQVPGCGAGAVWVGEWSRAWGRCDTRQLGEDRPLRTCRRYQAPARA